MENSRHLNLPFIAPSQAQKHVTHNEAIKRLDEIIHISVLSHDVNIAPVSPADGARYIIGMSPEGAWEGYAQHIACFEYGSWGFTEMEEGWIVWVKDAGENGSGDAFISNGAALVPLSRAPSTLGSLGINTAADSVNRLAVKSDAVLLSHDDISPGSGDMRLALNKQAETSTGSLVFQTGYSSRAEIGLTGDNHLSVKVSQNGADWTEAIRVDSQTGDVSFPATPTPSPAIFNLFKDAGRFGGAPEPTSISVSTFAAPNYVSAFNGAAFQEGPKFSHNNSTFGGSGQALSPIISELISTLKTSHARRFGLEFFTLKITAGSGQSGLLQVSGQTYYVAAISPGTALPPMFSRNYFIKVETGRIAIGRLGALYLNGASVADDVDVVITPEDGWQQITHISETHLPSSVGYMQNTFRTYAQAGAVFYLAAPALIPAKIPLTAGHLYGIIPGLDAWA